MVEDARSQKKVCHVKTQQCQPLFQRHLRFSNYTTLRESAIRTELFTVLFNEAHELSKVNKNENFINQRRNVCT